MTVNGTCLSMVRGDSESISVTISGYDMQPGDFLEMTIRKNLDAPVTMYRKVTEFPDNKAVINFFPEETQDLELGDYVYDMQLTFGGAVKTIIKPTRFTLEADVTHDCYLRYD